MTNEGGKTPRVDPDLLAWAAEQVARAPRISPADAQPLIALFRAARGETPSSTPGLPLPAIPWPSIGPAKDLLFLYRFYDECGCLLYVGITNDFDKRHAAHRRESAWYEFASRHEVAPLESEGEAWQAEREAIRTETPAFNSTGRPQKLGKALLLGYLRKHPELIAGA